MQSDWATIDGLRRAYFHARGEPVQERPEAVRWRVVQDGNTISGVYSYCDYHDVRQRWILDIYLAAGIRGRRAGAAIWAEVMNDQRKHGYTIAGGVAPDNTPQLQMLYRRGFRPVGIVVMKEAE